MAGLLWQLGLVLQVNSQRAIASYSALYSGFSAIPIFFVWMYVSWTIVLAGAELASSYQHETVMRQRRRARDADEGFRERLAIELLGRVCDASWPDGRAGPPKRWPPSCARPSRPPPR